MSTLAVAPAAATTVVNQDKREHVLTVDRGLQESDARIAPGASLRVECSEGCSLRVRGSGYDKPFGADDKLVIDGRGLLRYLEEIETTGSVQHVPSPTDAKR